MTGPHFIGEAEMAGKLKWAPVVEAIRQGHLLPKAEIKDLVLGATSHSFLNRAAWIKGLGGGIKSVTVFPGNPDRISPLPTVQGVFLLFDEETGSIKATIDGPLITWWKTAADSVLGARLLARQDSERALIIGAGTLAHSLVEAYLATLPSLQEIGIWARDGAKADKLAALIANDKVKPVSGPLEDAVGNADIVSTATSSLSPVIKGEWVQPGTHVDLVGAFRSDMREADDALLQKAEIFVDSKDTTIEHIGELMIPLRTGAIEEGEVLGDLYALVSSKVGRKDRNAITVYKNGGGAHLDLMTANVIYQQDATA